MALRYERRHLPYRTWYHKRYEGGGGSAADCCFLLLEGGSLELLEGGCLELLECSVACCLELAAGGCLDLAGGGALKLESCNPPSGNCPVLPQDGIVATNATFDPAMFFNASATGTTIVQDPSISFPNNPQCFASTIETITANGQGFSFQFPGPFSSTNKPSVGLGSTNPTPAIDCGDNTVIIGNECRWLEAPEPDISFTANPMFNLIEVNAGNVFGTRPLVAGDVYTIIRCGDKVCMYVNDELVVTGLTSEPMANPSRLNIYNLAPGFAATQNIATDIQYLTNVVCP